ncbi:MAG: ParA family protein [Deltaproteobacteria bacterium]|nr:ParA family protein [Deltaproteobacteria bacterium]
MPQKPHGPPILCIANQKGGVGKTTTAVNLAAGLTRRGLRTLLVDLDIQGSATATLLGPLSPGERTVAECLVEEKPLDEVVRQTATERLLIVPAGEALAIVDIHLATAMGRERVLERCLESGGLREEIDVVIIDTAPYLGLLTINALVAADHVLIPVSCEYLPILGLKLFNDTLTRIRQRLGAKVAVLGYLLTMVDRRESITTEVEGLLRSTFGDQVFPHGIRVNTKHKASPSHRKTIFEYEGPGGRGRTDYERLTEEVIRRAGLRTKEAATSPAFALPHDGVASVPRASSACA